MPALKLHKHVVAKIILRVSMAFETPKFLSQRQTWPCVTVEMQNQANYLYRKTRTPNKPIDFALDFNHSQKYIWI